MKKGLLIVAMMIAVSASAQEMTSKKGTPILPEAGDWSVGVGANSTLKYFGNLMNGNNAAPSFDWASTANVISFKMMKDANTAYRANVRIGIGSTKTTAAADTIAGTLNSAKVSGTHINLGAGIQMYRGKGRLRGYYGGEGNIGLSGSKTTNTYNGNAEAGSTLTDKAGTTFSFGLRGFIGAEYFFAPKMSVGGEFGWGLMISSTGASSTTVANGLGGSTDNKGGKSSSFGFDTDNASGALVLNLYF